jgi:6-pyruvoyltetrahydropterin/6-carboxytetrahydropterin synthase
MGPKAPSCYEGVIRKSVNVYDLCYKQKKTFNSLTERATYRATKELKFEAAHRLLGKGVGHCGYIHGHSFKIEVTVATQELDETGFSLEFGKLKGPLQDWIDQKWDHSLILCEKDPYVFQMKKLQNRASGCRDFFTRLFLVPFNPTAENLGRYFWEIVEELLSNSKDNKRVWVQQIKFFETATSSITITKDTFRTLVTWKRNR